MFVEFANGLAALACLEFYNSLPFPSKPTAGKVSFIFKVIGRYKMRFPLALNNRFVFQMILYVHSMNKNDRMYFFGFPFS